MLVAFDFFATEKVTEKVAHTLGAAGDLFADTESAGAFHVWLFFEVGNALFPIGPNPFQFGPPRLLAWNAGAVCGRRKILVLELASPTPRANRFPNTHLTAPS